MALETAAVLCTGSFSNYPGFELCMHENGNA